MEKRVQVTLVSFGYLYAPPPDDAVVTVDLREHFSDPARVRGMTDRTGTETVIRELVLDTAGIVPLAGALVAVITAYALAPRPIPIVAAIGCAGGHHRSVVVTDETAGWFRNRGIYDVTVIHRDIDKPVINRPTIGQ